MKSAPAVGSHIGRTRAGGSLGNYPIRGLLRFAPDTTRARSPLCHARFRRDRVWRHEDVRKFASLQFDELSSRRIE